MTPVRGYPDPMRRAAAGQRSDRWPGRPTHANLGSGTQRMKMEGWKDGRMEGWKDGRLEGWKDGRMEGWKDGRMEGFKRRRRDLKIA